MNLNYPYCKYALDALMQTASNRLEEHNLVIDFDGEVILDPEIHFPAVQINKYRFYTRVPDGLLRNPLSLASLYDALEEAYNSLNRVADSHIKNHRGHIKIAA